MAKRSTGFMIKEKIKKKLTHILGMLKMQGFSCENSFVINAGEAVYLPDTKIQSHVISFDTFKPK